MGNTWGCSWEFIMDIGIGIVLEFDMGWVRELVGWNFVRPPFLSSPLRFWSSQERQQNNNNRGDIKNKNNYNEQPIRLESGEGEGWGDRGMNNKKSVGLGGRLEGVVSCVYTISFWFDCRFEYCYLVVWKVPNHEWGTVSSISSISSKNSDSSGNSRQAVLSNFPGSRS